MEHKRARQVSRRGIQAIINTHLSIQKLSARPKQSFCPCEEVNHKQLTEELSPFVLSVTLSVTI